MARVADHLERVEVASRAELRRWLARHHRQKQGIWLVTFKKAAGARYLPYDAIVEEALCFGWVDSLVREADELRSMRLLSPRKPGSGWSKVNKARVDKLIKGGRMTAAGLTKIEQAKRDGSWSRLDKIETLSIPPDLAAALAAAPPAADNFEAFPRSSKRLILEWIANAKRPATRAQRIHQTAALAAKNQRANHYRPNASARALPADPPA